MKGPVRRDRRVDVHDLPSENLRSLAFRIARLVATL